MKKYSLLPVLLLLICSFSHAQTFPYYPPNDLTGKVTVALFTNGQASTLVQILKSQWLTNSYGQADLEITVFPLSIIPSISGDEKVAYEELRSLIEGNPGYFVYIFNATFCTCACSFGYAMSPQRQAIAYVRSLDPSVVGHELSHALGLEHYHSIGSCPTFVIDEGCITREEGGGSISFLNHLPLGAKEQFGWIIPQEITQSGTIQFSPYEQGQGLLGIKIPYSDIYPPSYLYLYYRSTGLVIDFVEVSHRWVLNWHNYANYKFAVLNEGQEKCINRDTGSINISVVGIGLVDILFNSEPCAIPPCEPLPIEYQTLPCPRGYRGSITQERVSTCPGPTWGPWMTIENSCQKRGRK